MKRTFDLIASIIGLVLLGAFIAGLAIAVRLTSPGPGIFSQTRIGRKGAPFRCHKLRTLRHGAPSVPTHESFVSEITPLGRWLRRSKLDELPQLLNVLKGEMSLVGPRPSLPAQHALISARNRYGVLVLRPGITGLAQIRGFDMSDPERLAAIDAEYLSRATFRFDLWILARTLMPGSNP